MKKSLAILMLSVIMMTFATAAWAQHNAAPAAEPQKAETPAQAPAKPLDNIVIWKALGAALAIGFAAFATAWAQSKIGSAAAGAIAEKPEIGGLMIVLEALPETIIILGFVIAIMIVGLK
jgi:V/A-type H+/Na+-transporting ATPase subunit K